MKVLLVGFCLGALLCVLQADTAGREWCASFSSVTSQGHLRCCCPTLKLRGGLGMGQEEGPAAPDYNQGESEQDERESSDSANDGQGPEEDVPDDDDSSAGEDDEFFKQFPQNIEEHPELMKELELLEEMLIDADRKPPPSRQEKTRKDFVEAANEGDMQRVRDLLAKHRGTIPDLTESRDHRVNITALMHAAANGHVTVVRYLLKHGADPRALGSLDETAMHLAACSGNSEICVLLYMAAPETLHWRDKDNATAIIHSADSGHAHTTRTLYNLGAKLQSYGPECTVRTHCQGMRWPLLHPSPFSEKPETICPLCMYDYVLLDEPPGVDEGSPMSFSALLPPEFYPCPAYVIPTDGSGPPRAGPCWTPEGAAKYEGDGVPQRWPVIEDSNRPKRKIEEVDLLALAPKADDGRK